MESARDFMILPSICPSLQTLSWMHSQPPTWYYSFGLVLLAPIFPLAFLMLEVKHKSHSFLPLLRSLSSCSWASRYSSVSFIWLLKPPWSVPCWRLHLASPLSALLFHFQPNDPAPRSLSLTWLWAAPAFCLIPQGPAQGLVHSRGSRSTEAPMG